MAEHFLRLARFTQKWQSSTLLTTPRNRQSMWYVDCRCHYWGDLQFKPSIIILSQLDSLPASSGLLESELVFPSLFSGLGVVKGPPHKIRLQDNTSLYSLMTPRRVPLPMVEKVAEELKKWRSRGSSGKWTSLPTGMRAWLSYPSPMAAFISAVILHVSTSVCDARGTYCLRYCYRCLQFGISSALEYFQKRMIEVLDGLSGVIVVTPSEEFRRNRRQINPLPTTEARVEPSSETSGISNTSQAEKQPPAGEQPPPATTSTQLEPTTESPMAPGVVVTRSGRTVQPPSRFSGGGQGQRAK